VNVKHRQCARPSCFTRPAFNFPGQQKGVFCNKHKENGMVNVDRKDLPEGGAKPCVCCLCSQKPLAAPSCLPCHASVDEPKTAFPGTQLCTGTSAPTASAPSGVHHSGVMPAPL